MQELLTKVLDFQLTAQSTLTSSTRPDSCALDEMLDTAMTLDVDLPEIARLRQLLSQAKWLDQVGRSVSDGSGEFSYTSLHCIAQFPIS